MLDTTSIATIATTAPKARRAVRDILDGIKDLPAAEAIDHLRAAQDAVWHGAWRMPEGARTLVIEAIGTVIARATAA